MNCSKAERLLALHAGGDLPAEETRKVEEHLRTCLNCQELAKGLAVSHAALKSLHEEELDASRLADVRRRVLDRAAAARPSWLDALRWWHAAPAGLAVAAVMGIALYPRSDVPLPPEPPVIRLVPPVIAKNPPPAIQEPERPRAAAPQEPLLVKMFTDDPDVVIYWLIDPNGD